jgi:hypothetical protein
MGYKSFLDHPEMDEPATTEDMYVLTECMKN